MATMKVVGEAGRDNSGFICVTLKCGRCDATKVVRRAQVKYRNKCAKCSWQDLPKRKGKSMNNTPAGNPLGRLNLKKDVYIYLEAVKSGECVLATSNSPTRTKSGIVSVHQWKFTDECEALIVLDTVGRRPPGTFVEVLGDIEALMRVLKGE